LKKSDSKLNIQVQNDTKTDKAKSPTKEPAKESAKIQQ